MRAFVFGSVLTFITFAAMAIAACGDDETKAVGASANPADAGALGDGADDRPLDGTVGDGQVSPDVMVERSGARIKLDMQASADGFRRRVGLYDSQLGFACVVASGTDAVRRCFPNTNASAQVFTDGTCQTRVATWEACAAKPAYVVASVDGACSSTKLGFAIGADVTPAQLFAMGPTGCEPVGAPNASYKYAAVTESVPDTFARVDEKVFPLLNGLDAVFDQTADGLHAFRTARSTKHGAVPCDFALAADKALRCVPSYGERVAPSLPNLFGDPTCTTEVAESTCSSFELARQVVSGCPVSWRMFRAGAELASDAGVFQKNGVDCKSTSRPSTSTFRTLVAELDPSELIAGKSAPATTTTRLQAESFEVANVRFPSTSSLLRDTLKDATCGPQRAADGKMRCVPNEGAHVFDFADDECTVPVATVFKSACGTPKYALENRAAACAPTAIAYPMLGKRSTTVTYHRASNGLCVMQDLGSTADIYDVGAEIAASEWVEITSERP